MAGFEERVVAPERGGCTPFSGRARTLAAIAAVISLTVLGGVTAAPAAADVSVSIVVNDNSNGAV